MPNPDRQLLLSNMDILVILLLIIFYVVPEILRRARKPKTYKYPEFPSEQPEPTTVSANATAGWESGNTSVLAKQNAADRPKAASPPVSPPAEQPIALDGIVYGLVMAEVLGPPKCRAMRRVRR